MDRDLAENEATLSSIQELIKVIIQKQDSFEQRQK